MLSVFCVVRYNENVLCSFHYMLNRTISENDIRHTHFVYFKNSSTASHFVIVKLETFSVRMSSRNTPSKTKKTRSESRIDNSVTTNKNLSFLTSSSVSDLRSVTKTPPVTTNKSKSVTSLNACYTPSSLYKNLGATPKSAVKRFAASMESKSTPECFSKVSFETPKHSVNKSLDGMKNKDKAEVSNLKVAVRVRPMNAQELKSSSSSRSCVTVSGSEVIVSAGHTADGSAGVTHSFNYDDVYWSQPRKRQHTELNDQNTVFKGTALPLVDVAFEGKNCCLFAYGQTGSGKSYSMMGLDGKIEVFFFLIK